MKRSLSRPQQLKEQLLQAIDAQNNIQNLAAVLDVICCLENYPMTKEALVETRLGKLINDLRKRSTDEELVKRLKKLVRSWQRLLGLNEATAKEFSCCADRIKSAQAECISGSTQTLSENHSKTVSCSNVSQRDEMSRPVAGQPINYLAIVRPSRIPVRAIKPYSSFLEHPKQSSASSSLRTSLSNQHSQDHKNIIVRDFQKSQRCGTSTNPSTTKNILVATEPALCSTTLDLPSKSSIQDSHTKTSELMKNQNNLLKPAPLKVNLCSLDEVSRGMTETNLGTFENKTKKNQHSSRTNKLEERCTEDGTKPAQLIGNKLPYDPHPQQIKSISNNSTSDQLKCFCSFQQTNWRELSQSTIIAPDPNLQNSLQTSDSQILGMNFSESENSKQEKDYTEECRKTPMFIPDFPVTDLPGVSRKLTDRDLHRMHRQQWHGVNGCYDNQNNWHDWTQSITLDPYADGSKLKISPYVCLDYRHCSLNSPNVYS
ncbi:mediator of RNA polymerase II transcription subunit 26-like isoform X2 [Myxocyprinus asiaticus]|uniref:mediator of RNA polymerase II transcription subunit 26-like isoform X2 n=1 Tax=Myxocyprinus asiaticus TaxID=70543 RepID=UPI0022222940|nr:mediator of RNA polymerase II transcription subunit 26-like isoform X2 [Myxocyprinus asiaticus]